MKTVTEVDTPAGTSERDNNSPTNGELKLKKVSLNIGQALRRHLNNDAVRKGWEEIKRKRLAVQRHSVAP